MNYKELIRNFWSLNSKSFISPVATKVYITILFYTKSFGGNDVCFVNKKTLENHSGLEMKDVENGLEELAKRGLIILLDYYRKFDYSFFPIQLLKEDDNPETLNLLNNFEHMRNFGDISAEAYSVYVCLLYRIPIDMLKSENSFCIDAIKEEFCMSKTEVINALDELKEKKIISLNYSSDKELIKYKVIY